MVIICSLLPESTAQAIKIDSIMLSFNRMPDDSIKMDSVRSQLHKYEAFASEPARVLGKELLRLAQKLNSQKNEIDGLLGIGTSFRLLGQFDSAFYYYDLVKKILEAENDQKGLMLLWVRIGIANADLNTPSADSASLDAFVQTEILARALEDDHAIAVSLANQAHLLRQIGDNERAIDRLQQAVQINEQLDNQRSLALNLVSMGIQYQFMGNLEDAEVQFLKAYDIGQALDDAVVQINASAYLSEIYGGQEKWDQALEHALIWLGLEKVKGKNSTMIQTLAKIVGYSIEVGDIDGANEYMKEADELYAFFPNISVGVEADYLKNKGKLLMESNQFQEAGTYFEQLKSFLPQSQPERKRYELSTLADYYEKVGDYAQAYFYLKEYNTLSDTLVKQAHRKSMNELNVRFETVQKEKIILQLERDQKANQLLQSQQKYAIAGGIGGLLLVLVWAVALFRNNQVRKKHNGVLAEKNTELHKQKQEIEVKNQQNETLLKEIHHRVKNNLQFVSSLLSLQSASIEDQAVKNAMLDSQSRVASMSLLHQKLYRGVNLAAVEMKQYFSSLTETLIDSYAEDLENLDIEINMQDIELDVDHAIPLGLLANELITNSLKYAFPEENENSRIEIQLKREGGECTLDIRDNGIGEASIGEQEKQGGGFGNQLVEMLTLQLKGELIQSQKNGFHTQIKFPYLLSVA